MMSCHCYCVVCSCDICAFMPCLPWHPLLPVHGFLLRWTLLVKKRLLMILSVCTEVWAKVEDAVEH